MKPLSSSPHPQHLSAPNKCLSQKALAISPGLGILRAGLMGAFSSALFGSWVPEASARPRLGLETQSCRSWSFEQVVDWTAEQGLREVQVNVKHLDPEETPEALQLKKFHLQNRGVRAYAGRYSWGNDPEKNRRIFELAKTFDMELLVLEVSDVNALNDIEALAKSYELQVALRPTLTEANLASWSQAISSRDPKIGLSLEVNANSDANEALAAFFREHHARVFDLPLQSPAKDRPEALKAWAKTLKEVDWIGVMALGSTTELAPESLGEFASEGRKLFRQNFVEPQFRAAAVKKDITPNQPQPMRGYPNPRISEGVHDRINHRIAMMDDGEEAFVLISSEFCNIPPATSDRFTQNIARKLGVSPANVWWTVTHTHSAPYYGIRPSVAPPQEHGKPWDSAYDAQVEEALMAGVLEAKSQLAPAKLGVGWGHAVANINRRARGSNGGTGLGMNPEGPVDRRIGLIRLDHATTGKPIALIANYAMHGTVLGSTNTLISGDAQGYVSNLIEEQIGATTLYINGAAGNLAPLYSVPASTSSVKNLPYFKALLADKILEANQRLQKTTDRVRFQTRLARVESATDTRKPWPSTLLDYRRSEGTFPKVGIPLRTLKINDDILLWAMPLEMFCEISNEVRERSSVPFTFYYGYTGGGMGYLPSPEEFPHGGYEVGASYFTPSTPGLVIDAVLEVAHPKTQAPTPTSKP